VAWEEARAEVSRPHVARAMVQGRASGVEGDRIRLEESRNRCVGMSQQGETHLCQNTTRDEDAVGDEVKTSIPLVVRGVAEEDATSGTGR
jgi:hypothetical protein